MNGIVRHENSSSQLRICDMRWPSPRCSLRLCCHRQAPQLLSQVLNQSIAFDLARHRRDSLGRLRRSLSLMPEVNKYSANWNHVSAEAYNYLVLSYDTHRTASKQQLSRKTTPRVHVGSSSHPVGPQHEKDEAFRVAEPPYTPCTHDQRPVNRVRAQVKPA